MFRSIYDAQYPIVSGARYVYVFEGPIAVKVGITKDVPGRIATVEGHGGFRITNVKAFGPFSNASAVESKAHAMLSDCRTVGEWFSIPFEKAVSAVRVACSDGVLRTDADDPCKPAENTVEGKYRFIGNGMNDRQKQLLRDIMTATDKLPPEKQYQLLGVAQGLGMVPAPAEKEEK